MKKILFQRAGIIIIFLFSIFSCSRFRTHIPIKPLKNIAFSGLRSSRYGARPFPEPENWTNAIHTLTDYFHESTPCALWIVGTLHRDRMSCHLEFPGDSTEYNHIVFQDVDKHEPYLNYFDMHDIKIFLQVEPANGSITKLIDIVMNRYKHHECVIGFGVDVEWYREHEKPGWGMKVNDDSAKVWEARLKSYNPSYQLFLKHWDRNWMPPNYRGDIIFVNDSQELTNFNAMVKDFINDWADYFKPNMVFFQIGYRSDRKWWDKFENPPKEMGEQLAQRIQQKCGIFWVDFTMRDVLPFDNDTTNP